MLWKVGVYSRLSERLIRDGRDSAKRVVSETIYPFCSPQNDALLNDPFASLETEVKVLGLDGGVLFGGFGLKMNGITLDVNSLDRADILTSAASYA